MKTTRFFAAAIVLLSVLSCQKEEQIINNPESEAGVIITCTFANNDAAAKTTLDGVIPKWAAGDKIMLYDGSSNTQELTLAASGTASSTTGIIDGTDKTQFTFVKPSGWDNVYAIYPSSACASGFSASEPKINFAGQDGTFAKANICAAADISGTMSFRNVGAILKFTSKAAKVMNIYVPSAEMQNDYKVAFAGDTPGLTSVSASHIPEVDLSNGTGVVYIGVPACTIAASSTFKYRSASRGVFGIQTTSKANTLEVNKIYTLGAITLSGEPNLYFSVSGSKEVYFSKGNLQATVDASGSPLAWNFATDQYGYIGNAVANTSIGTTAGVIDLFGWSTEAEHNNWGIHTKTSATTGYTDDVFKDWGKNAIANGGNTANLWSTLSQAEWNHLINSRTSSTVSSKANARYCKATVNSVPGLILFPDTYTHPSDVTYPAAASINSQSEAFASVSYTADDWKKMESAGCVFLPIAGSREGSTVNNLGLTAQDTPFGVYWSYTRYESDNNQAYRLYFYSSGVATAQYNIYAGYSVRLVTTAQ